jgi:catechol 2,3-dioxygenase-like lactoylglutathione lyase family enzyme
MVTLSVRDMAHAVAFYEKGLGLPKIHSPPEVAFFNLKGTWLGLYGWDDLAADASQSA